MAKDDQPLGYHTSQEESLRQAEAAFGSAAPKAPDALPTGAPPTAPAGIPGVPRRRFPLGRMILALFPLAIIGGVAVGGYALIKNATDDTTNPSSPISVPNLPGVPSIPTPPKAPSSPESPSKPGSPPGSSSNFSLAGLARSKGTAQKLAGPGARIELVRVTEDQLQVIAHSGSRRKIVLVSSSFTRSIDTPGTGGLDTFPFAAFRPAALTRLVGGLTRTYHVPASGIDYIVLIKVPSQPLGWLAYPRSGGGHFSADAAGGSLRRVG